MCSKSTKVKIDIKGTIGAPKPNLEVHYMQVKGFPNMSCYICDNLTNRLNKLFLLLCQMHHEVMPCPPTPLKKNARYLIRGG